MHLYVSYFNLTRHYHPIPCRRPPNHRYFIFSYKSRVKINVIILSNVNKLVLNKNVKLNKVQLLL